MSGRLTEVLFGRMSRSLAVAWLLCCIGSTNAARIIRHTHIHAICQRHAHNLKMAESSSTAPCAVLFDADGTLLDSLPPHVDFCHMMNAELGLKLSLPDRTDVASCRRIAAAPMANFFRAAGFPEDVIDGCVEAYEARFATECKVAPFAGVQSLLSRLASADVQCAVVSSNTAANVRAGLGPELAAYLSFIDGIDNAPADKAEAIASALVRLNVDPASAVYVGDTRKDCVKATAVGVPFVGVDYGFEALANDRDAALEGASVAQSVGELEELLFERFGE